MTGLVQVLIAASIVLSLAFVLALGRPRGGSCCCGGRGVFAQINRTGEMKRSKVTEHKP